MNFRPMVRPGQPCHAVYRGDPFNAIALAAAGVGLDIVLIKYNIPIDVILLHSVKPNLRRMGLA